MTLETVFMLIGFSLAAYAVVGNDSIQTLGTFLASNRHRPWWVLWIFAGSIMTVVLIWGWFAYNGDVSWGRLTGEDAKFPERTIQWFYLLPPLALLFLTKLGFPVSTSFLVLIAFSPAALAPMLEKTLWGYVVAMGSSLLLYALVFFVLEKYFRTHPGGTHPGWIVAQWVSTGWLWSQWLIQDLANIYVYLPRQLPVGWLILSIVIMLAMQAYIFANRGGKIQKVVLSKTNTTDVRSATIIDFIYGCILFVFKEHSDVPMSTTWVFLGLLAGRELGIRITRKLFDKYGKGDTQDNVGKVRVALGLIGSDLGKAAVGLVISIILAFIIGYIGYGRIPTFF